VATLELGVLVSGRGSNLQAILDAIASGKLDARVRLVVSNQADAVALERARLAGIDTQCIPHKAYTSREDFDRALVEALRAAGVQWVVLAGFMRVLSPTYLSAYGGRTINIHPSLLPAFPGVHAQRQALDYGVKVSGCTVHLIDEGVDTGPILAQRAVLVHPTDDEKALAERILQQEHEVLVSVLQALAADKICIERYAGGVRPRVVCED
jgi:phosphoribosylglycinamide formyltransferase 1